MKSIFTITLSPAVDKSSSVDHVLPEHKLRCIPPKFEPGGGGINVSRAIKKLGGESIAIYTKGGPTGELLQKLLEEEKIKQHPIQVKSWNRENFIVVESSTNRQFRFGMPGPEILEGEWKALLGFLENETSIDYLVVSGSTPPGVPPDFYRQVARIAKKKNARLVLDTSGEPLKEAVKEGIYLLKPNIRELSQLVGKELNTGPEQEEAALDIIDQGKIEVLVVSMGASGAMLASRDGVFYVSAPSVAKKSTVGAGDSMVAGIVWSLSREWDPADSLRYGIACGTAATMNPGTELCKLQDVETLFRWIKTSAEKRHSRI